MIILDQDIKNARILVVDDEPINLFSVTELLEINGYRNITKTTDPLEAVKLYASENFDLILLDINMPKLDGFGVMAEFEKILKNIRPPVLVLTALTDKETRKRALQGGARDFLTKPFDDEEISCRVKNLLEMQLSLKMLSRYSSNLERVVKKRTQALLDTQLEIVQRLGFAAEYRDTETANHCIRVGETARLIGEHIGIKGEALETLSLAAPMHDIGKIGIADVILLKPGKYTPEERKIMEQHTTIGGEILKGGSSALLIAAREVALTHHERWDGTGYPNGLTGKDIPINGRIVMVADVFDALLMVRPYKKAWLLKEAVDFIKREAGRMIDPMVAEAFEARLPEILAIREKYADEVPDEIV